ncbi:3-dehydroquinate dehydratase (3-dehydroquinase), partial [Ceratobasidium sp. 392]
MGLYSPIAFNTPHSVFVATNTPSEARTGKSISHFVRTKGQSAFRATETKIVQDPIAKGPKRTIISTRGGIIELPGNQVLLTNYGRTVGLVAYTGGLHAANSAMLYEIVAACRDETAQFSRQITRLKPNTSKALKCGEQSFLPPTYPNFTPAIPSTPLCTVGADAIEHRVNLLNPIRDSVTGVSPLLQISFQ